MTYAGLNRLIALAVATTLTNGCGSLHPDQPLPNPSVPSTTTSTATPTATLSTTPTVMLTAANPTARVPITPVDGAKVIRLSIESIENPARQAITMSVVLIRPDNTTIEIGTVSPYPVDRPAELRLALPAAVIEAAAASGTLLRIELLPLDIQPLRTDVSVIVAVTIGPA